MNPRSCKYRIVVCKITCPSLTMISKVGMPCLAQREARRCWRLCQFHLLCLSCLTLSSRKRGVLVHSLNTKSSESLQFLRQSGKGILRGVKDVLIVRHVKVKADTSPFDGNRSYWAMRRGNYPGVSGSMANLLTLLRFPVEVA